MLKKLLVATAVSGLMMSSAWAQDRTAPVTSGTAPSDSLSSAKFIPAQGADQWVFSKYKGTNVLGPNDEHIGDVSDLLFDRNGKILGVVVGVGGLLGIGQKNVAIDMSAFQVVPASTGTTLASSSNDPTDVKLKVSWNKDQLQAAPDFQYYKATASTGIGPTIGMSPRPNPAAPAPRGQ